jgi:hypothetical protein
MLIECGKVVQQEQEVGKRRGHACQHEAGEAEEQE